jgi:nucleoid DNA-binding protein
LSKIIQILNGAKINIPASKVPKFTAGKAFKGAVNGKTEKKV